MGPEMIVGMLSGIPIFAWAPTFWAWILIFSEIGFGLAILSNWKMKLSVWPPAIILVVASFTMHYADWVRMLVNIGLASNYVLLGSLARHR